MSTSGDDEKSAKQRVLELVIAERRRRICASRAVRIVEQYSTKNVTRHFLCKTVGLIERSHWDDAVDERNGEGLCGYVMCSSKPLMDEGRLQQYRICSRTNRVYDMAEYNRFCSVQCCKRSNHVKEQIPDTPVVSRNHLMAINVDLLEDKVTEETTPNLAEGTMEEPISPEMAATSSNTETQDGESQLLQRSSGRRGKKSFSVLNEFCNENLRSNSFKEKSQIDNLEILSSFSENEPPSKGRRISHLVPSCEGPLSNMVALVTQKIINAKEDDEFDIMGRIMATKLRRLPNHRRIMAEKLISDVLFRAEMDSLDNNPVVISEPPPAPAPHGEHRCDFNFDPVVFARSMHEAR